MTDDLIVADWWQATSVDNNNDDDDGMLVVVTTSMTNFGPSSDLTEVILIKAIPMTLIYAIIFVTGIIGNVCTCAVISRNKYMHTATNYYLFSLAVSDLLLLVLGLPQEMYQLWFPLPYIFGETFCIIRGLAAEMSTNASILTITAFTVERYMAICHPLRSHTMSKLSRAIKLILIIWILAAGCAVPQAIQFGIVHMVQDDGTVVPDTADCLLKNPLKHAFELSTLFFFLIPMSLITVFYVLIALRLRNPGFKTGSIHGKHSSAGHHNRTESKRYDGTELRTTGGGGYHHVRSTAKKRSNSSSSSSRRAVVKMLVAVVVAFFVCWAPFHAQRLMAIYASADSPVAVRVYDALTHISGVLYYVSTTVNPILYHIMSFKFRMAFKETIGTCLARATSSTSSMSLRRHKNSSFNCGSTLRSRVITENTETTLETLITEDDIEMKSCQDGGGKRLNLKRLNKNGSSSSSKSAFVASAPLIELKRPPPPSCNGDSNNVIIKSDIVVKMTAADELSPVNPDGVNNFMTELNVSYKSNQTDDGAAGAMKSSPVQYNDNGPNNNGNGYCVSPC